jgi:hypothetical protein
MDPLITAAIAGAAGGAASKLIQQGWDAGKKWLDTYFKDHLPQAQESAKQNALDFLNDLAKRVHDVEESVKNIPNAKKQIEEALADPDFSAMFQQALLASGRTDSKEKHKLLARAVSERLLSKQDSMVALAGNLACNAIPHLSPRHLRCLGVMSLIYGTRPQPFPPNIPPETFHDWWINWLQGLLSPVMPNDIMTQLDYAHLVSVSCITYDYIGTRDLKKILSPPENSGFPWDYDGFVKDTQLGKKLAELWESGMNHAVPTSSGRLIGIYVNDLLTSKKTIIHWD